MTLKQLAQALTDANIPFTVRTKRKEVYIEKILILYDGKAFVTPVEGVRFFLTAWESHIPLKNLKLEDLQPMIQSYRKFHPASPEISSGVTENFFQEGLTMRYDGIELKEVTESQIFSEPKTMLVWDDGDSMCLQRPVVSITVYNGVVAALVFVDTGLNKLFAQYRHCAEIPEETKECATSPFPMVTWTKSRKED